MVSPRKLLEKHAGKYSLLTRSYNCTYCGDPADGFDHVTPISVVVTLEELGFQFDKKQLVRCCNECNSLAGRQVFQRVKEKRAWLKARLRKRHKKMLEIPEWTDKELQEVDYTLRSVLEESLRQKARILRRLAWRR